MSQTVWEQNIGEHRLEITWSGAQTALPTGSLDDSSEKRTRYFFDVVVDDLYYFANRFLTSADAEGVTDENGIPILARTDRLLKVCANRISEAIERGALTELPNDLGYVEIAEIIAPTDSEV